MILSKNTRGQHSHLGLGGLFLSYISDCDEEKSWSYNRGKAYSMINRLCFAKSCNRKTSIVTARHYK